MKVSLVILSLMLFAGGVVGEELCDSKEFRTNNPDICEEISFTQAEFDEWQQNLSKVIWDGYAKHKAIAFGQNESGWGYVFFCNDKPTQLHAKNCAMEWCESKDLACYVSIKNNEFLKGEPLEKAKKSAIKKYLKNKDKKSYASNSSKKKVTPKGRRIALKELEKVVEKRWEKDYANHKAIAVGGDTEEEGSAYLCYGHNSLSSARLCALKGCEAQVSACVIMIENNVLVDVKVAQENLTRARNKSSNSPSIAQSQSSSSTVNQQCLSQLQTDRDRMYRACLMSAKTKQGGFGGTLAIMGSCKDRAIRQFPNNICYGASPPQPLGPIGSIDPQDRNQSNTGWKYVLTLDSATSLCPMTATRWLYSLEHSEVSGMKRICYYK